MLAKNDVQTKPFFIAEIGQNHQGDLDLAREYIKVFAQCGADAVKFQSRDIDYLFSEDARATVYNSENAFADTYGEHRKKLELNRDEVAVLIEECRAHNIKFASTPFDEPSLEMLLDLGADIIKVASFDLGNLPFLEKISKSGKPVVLSVGGGQMDQIKDSVETLCRHNGNVAVLHCVSEYPCEFNRLGFDSITQYIEMFPDCAIGSSDHFNGILSGPVAYMMGARVFEKHVTLNRSWKGTDHSFALEPDGFRKFVRDTKRVKEMMPPKSVDEIGKEPVFKKLGKSLIAAVDIAAGTELTMDNLSGRIFTKQHVPVRNSNRYLGRIAKTTIKAGDPIQDELLD